MENELTYIAVAALFGLIAAMAWWRMRRARITPRAAE